MGYFKKREIDWQEVERLKDALYVDIVLRESVGSVFEHWRDRLTPAERVEVLEEALDYELWGQLMSTNILLKQAIYG